MNVNMDKLIDDVFLAEIQESKFSPMTMSMAINSVCQLLTLMMTTASFELVHVVKVSALHLSLIRTSIDYSVGRWMLLVQHPFAIYLSLTSENRII